MSTVVILQVRSPRVGLVEGRGKVEREQEWGNFLRNERKRSASFVLNLVESSVRGQARSNGESSEEMEDEEREPSLSATL